MSQVVRQSIQIESLLDYNNPSHSPGSLTSVPVISVQDLAPSRDL